MTHHILLATWSESSKAYESFTQLKNADIGSINQTTIIERLADGSVKVQDQDGKALDANTWTGGLLGSLFGILGGPLGILLGFSTGALFGSFFDADQNSDDLAVLSKISQALPIGSVGLFIDIDEQNDKLADDFFKNSNATLYRWDYDEVEAEIEASVETWEEVNRQANLALKQQKKSENKEKRKQKWEEFKSKFHTSTK
ncbi:DUF1269 domain-containing protein [Acinetobacter stercoris]|uniref:DUF1269 domain-containing protein n=1 Tax=Acinetobacter stercoris TaxID=2126983 RepID=A0A2U3N4A3_9GAMM|nr:MULTISPECIES: DUF1269 domain-containing protein [Acinetobacter]SPL72508.1 hypothetical protein KPC_3686 [Acinetobacter stercoris]